VEPENTPPLRPDSEEAPFRLLEDSGNRDPTTERRSEIKFLLPHADLGKIRSILEVNCRRIRHDGPVSLVNSLYFDDAGLGAYRENLDGVGTRMKVRLRWYGQKDDEGRFHFEIKKRTGLTMGKDRLAVHSRVPLSSLTFQNILNALCAILPVKQREALIRRPDPILISEYKREYFREHYSPVRITLDFDVTYFDQSGKRRPGKRFGVRVPEWVIVEGKAPVGEELRLRRLLFPLQPRITRSSKYVMGCQRLGLAAARPRGLF
jgi:hypothetical protein